MIREPAVAGQFYPGTKQALEKAIATLIEKKGKKQRAVGIVSPHAGYMCSGAVAGALFSKLELPDAFIIMGPNHTGNGRPFSIMAEGSWKIPLGEVKIDSKIAKAILDKSSFIQEDLRAHSFEHSIEVQLPFLQYIKEKVTFVPLLLSHADIATYRQIGKTIAETIKNANKDLMIIASSDMTHYEAQDIAKAKDEKAIEAISELDEEKLLRVVEEYDISMCGYAPTAAMLVAAKILGAKEAKLVKYQTSGDATGDYSAVVGYAGIMVS